MKDVSADLSKRLTGNQQLVAGRQAAPLFTDILVRGAVGLGAGAFFGFLFFKNTNSRLFFATFGAGTGLGMNYSQMAALSNARDGLPSELAEFDTQREEKELIDKL